MKRAHRIPLGGWRRGGFRSLLEVFERDLIVIVERFLLDDHFFFDHFFLDHVGAGMLKNEEELKRK